MIGLQFLSRLMIVVISVVVLIAVSVALLVFLTWAFVAIAEFFGWNSSQWYLWIERKLPKWLSRFKFRVWYENEDEDDENGEDSAEDR